MNNNLSIVIFLIFTFFSCESIREKKSYYKSGELHSIGFQLNGKAHGPVREYYKNGVPKRDMIFDHGLLNGYIFEYYSNGRLLAITKMKQGKVEDTVKVYNKSGALSQLIPYRNGLIHGKKLTFYESGGISEKYHYINDEVVKYEVLSPDGSIFLVQEMNDSIEHGYYLEYFDSTDIVKIRGQYYEGKKEGWWTVYNRESHQLDSLFYEDDKPIKLKK